LDFDHHQVHDARDAEHEHILQLVTCHTGATEELGSAVDEDSSGSREIFVIEAVAEVAAGVGKVEWKGVEG
jgi:hypothetical protein